VTVLLLAKRPRVGVLLEGAKYRKGRDFKTHFLYSFPTSTSSVKRAAVTLIKTSPDESKD
jgi:hypothetical protein